MGTVHKLIRSDDPILGAIYRFNDKIDAKTKSVRLYFSYDLRAEHGDQYASAQYIVKYNDTIRQIYPNTKFLGWDIRHDETIFLNPPLSNIQSKISIEIQLITNLCGGPGQIFRDCFLEEL